MTLTLAVAAAVGAAGGAAGVAALVAAVLPIDTHNAHQAPIQCGTQQLSSA